MACDLSSTFPNIICQNIPLVINKIYELSFDIVFANSFNKLTNVTVYMNGVRLLSVIGTNSTINNVSNSKKLFLSLLKQNQICFREITSFSSGEGPNIDNVTIFELSEDWASMGFLTYKNLYLSFSVFRVNETML